MRHFTACIALTTIFIMMIITLWQLRVNLELAMMGVR